MSIFKRFFGTKEQPQLDPALVAEQKNAAEKVAWNWTVDILDTLTRKEVDEYLIDADNYRVFGLYDAARAALSRRGYLPSIASEFEAEVAAPQVDLDSVTGAEIAVYLDTADDDRVLFLSRVAHDQLIRRGFVTAQTFQADVTELAEADLSSLSYRAVAEYLKTADPDVLDVLYDLLTEERARRTPPEDEPPAAPEDAPVEPPTTD
jgi:hypothetical protein